MADANQANFNDRVNKLNYQHRKQAGGYVQVVEHDGLIVRVKNRRAQRTFPFTGVFMTLGGFLGLKGALLAYLGPITYTSRIDRLAEGGMGEQFGAWVMSAGPVTTWIASQFSAVF